LKEEKADDRDLRASSMLLSMERTTIVSISAVQEIFKPSAIENK